MTDQARALKDSNAFQPKQHASPTAQRVQHADQLGLIGDPACEHDRGAVHDIVNMHEALNSQKVRPIRSQSALYADLICGWMTETERGNRGVIENT
jgi:hypothetical protein